MCIIPPPSSAPRLNSVPIVPTDCRHSAKLVCLQTPSFRRRGGTHLHKSCPSFCRSPINNPKCQPMLSSTQLHSPNFFTSTCSFSYSGRHLPFRVDPGARYCNIAPTPSLLPSWTPWPSCRLPPERATVLLPASFCRPLSFPSLFLCPPPTPPSPTLLSSPPPPPPSNLCLCDPSCSSLWKLSSGLSCCGPCESGLHAEEIDW